MWVRRTLHDTVERVTLLCAAILGALSTATATSPGLKLNTDKPKRTVPAVLVVGPGPGASKVDSRQQRFVTQVGLALDGFDVVNVSSSKPGFVRMTLVDQMREIEPLIEEQDAVAAVWLAEPSPGFLLVHLIAVRTGQTLVRTLRAQGQETTEMELALAVRELLGTAWLFAAPDALESPVMQALVDDLREQVIRAGRRYRGGASAVGLYGAVRVREGLSSRQGPSSLVGAEVGAELELAPDFSARLAGVLFTRLGNATKVGTELDSYGVAPLVGLSYTAINLDWLSGRLALAPAIELAFEWERLTFKYPPLDRTYTSARVRAAGGVDLRWQLSKTVAVFLAPRVGWTSQQDVFLRETDNTALLRTPRIDWGFVLGMSARPWR